MSETLAVVSFWQRSHVQDSIKPASTIPHAPEVRYQHASAEDFMPYARSELTRMDARLTFFALEDPSRTVLVTSKTAVLRGTITCRSQ